MITDPVELSELLQVTKDMIADDGIAITLLRETKTRTPSGGVRRDGQVPVPGGPVRRWFHAVTSDPFIQRTNQGEVITASHVLVGLPDDDILEKDEFIVGNRTFQVQEVHPDRSFETRAWVLEKA